MIVPVDILSYALGLFTDMKTRDFTIATIIGITPFSFVFAYLGSVPFQYQLIAAGVFGIVFLVGYIVYDIIKKRPWN